MLDSVVLAATHVVLKGSICKRCSQSRVTCPPVIGVNNLTNSRPFLALRWISPLVLAAFRPQVVSAKTIGLRVGALFASHRRGGCNRAEVHCDRTQASIGHSFHLLSKR